MSFEKMYIVWICAGIIFGVLEAVTVQLVSVWFVIGSCAALVSSLFGCKTLCADNCFYRNICFNAADNKADC